MNAATERFLTTYRGLHDALGRAPALQEVADALGLTHQAAQVTAMRIRAAGTAIPLSKIRRERSGVLRVVKRAHAGQPTER